MNSTVYDLVTTRILEALSKGVIPWKKPWFDYMEVPMNALSKRPYRGINVFLLGLAPFRDSRWLTFRQAHELGGNVKKGEKATIVVFWKHWELPEKDEESALKCETIPLLRYYSVFNAEQCEGLSLPSEVKLALTEHERIERAEILIRDMPSPPRIIEGGKGAWYRPSDDLVSIPALNSFVSSDAYYSTLLHELGHSTGHPSRLNRKGVTETVQFGSLTYSEEELVAELTSSMCCQELGLDNTLFENSTAYIQGWLSVFEGNPKMVVVAAARAQKAADYIKGVSKTALEAVA